MTSENYSTTHELVKEAYTRAIQKEGGCCGGKPSRSAAATLAGYGETDVANAPNGAVESSFGCGNPVGLAGLQPGDTVVDLGAGAGLDLILAARRVGPTGRIIGVDMTDAMIAAAKQNIAATGLTNIEVRKGLIENLPVDATSADWVVSNCVINLSPDKPRVFSEIARVLKPGGRFSISDIVVSDDIPTWIREMAGSYAACVGGAISETAYLDGLRAAGLTDVRVVDRLVYEPRQVVAMVVNDFPDLDQSLVDRALPFIENKVASLRVTGRK
ncbi:MAG: arsenite methyltransferase [Deltaproteobacteria bacterium]|nr:arsenite methyltransferase [Deltaproteobacteria bacterium]